MGAPRFDKTGAPIADGPLFGRRLSIEDEEDREEQLTPADSPFPQVHDAGGAVSMILEDVEQRRAELGVEEDGALHLEDAQDFISRAVAATAYAAGKVVEANQHLRPVESIERQHQEHLLAAYSGDLSDYDEQALYDEGIGPSPDEREHARLLAELESEDDDAAVVPEGEELDSDWSLD